MRVGLPNLKTALHIWLKRYSYSHTCITKCTNSVKRWPSRNESSHRRHDGIPIDTYAEFICLQTFVRPLADPSRERDNINCLITMLASRISWGLFTWIIPLKQHCNVYFTNRLLSVRETKLIRAHCGLCRQTKKRNKIIFKWSKIKNIPFKTCLPKS